MEQTPPPSVKPVQPYINAILKLPAYHASSKYGAQMGRKSFHSETPGSLYLQKLYMVDGDYDSGGAYWGSSRGSSLYCAFQLDGATLTTAIFVRAESRERAKVKVLEWLDANAPETGWTFNR